MKRLAVFPPIKSGDWVFRTSIADHVNILILAFGPESRFMMRYFVNEDIAKAWVDEVVAGKHIE